MTWFPFVITQIAVSCYNDCIRYVVSQVTGTYREPGFIPARQRLLKCCLKKRSITFSPGFLQAVFLPSPAERLFSCPIRHTVCTGFQLR